MTYAVMRCDSVMVNMLALKRKVPGSIPGRAEQFSVAFYTHNHVAAVGKLFTPTCLGGV